MTTTLLPAARTSAPLSRRHLLKLGLGSALGLGLAATGLSLPAAPALSVGAALPFVAYHGVTGAEHQNRFNDLSTKGYRVLSLSIYGLVGDPRYAAVWVRREGAAQRVVHGITADEYQRWFDQGVAMGFVPTIVSATGDVQTARFAAVAENNVSGPWVARHGIDVGQYVNQSLTARENDGLTLRSVAIYGNYFDRRYAGVWRQNVANVEFSASTNLETPQEYQRDFDFFTQRGWRPRYLAVSSSQAFAPVYSKDSVGQWVARHNLTADQYQQAFNENTANGMAPVVVQGSGIGSATRYAAIFLTQDAVSNGLVCGYSPAYRHLHACVFAALFALNQRCVREGSGRPRYTMTRGHRSPTPRRLSQNSWKPGFPAILRQPARGKGAYLSHTSSPPIQV